MLLLALMCAVLQPGVADAKKRIVVLGVRGKKGADAARLITSALSRRYDVVSAGRFRRAAGRLKSSTAAGRAAAAGSLRVSGIVSGRIVKSKMRWILRLSIFSGHNGKKVGSSSFPLRGSRVDMSTSRRVAQSLTRILRRTRSGSSRVAARPAKTRRRRKRRRRPPPPKPPKPAPPVVNSTPEGFDDGTVIAPEPDPPDDGYMAPEPADDPKGFSSDPAPSKGDDLGFSEADEELDTEVPEFSRRKRKKRKRRKKLVEAAVYTGEEGGQEDEEDDRKRRSWESIAELSVGGTVLSRSFDFYDPRIPAEPSNYRSGFVPALLLEGAVYPGAIWTRGHLARIGLLVEYWRVLGLKSQLPGYTEALSTTLHDLRIGLRYRWNLLDKKTSLILKAGLSFGRLGFVIHWSADQNLAPLPNIVYDYLDIAVAHFTLPFYTSRDLAFGGLASFDYMFIFSAGDIERTDSSGYGKSFIGGLDFGGGFYLGYSGFTFKLGGFYKHLFFDFNGQCYKTGTGCKVAGGALDRYLGFSATVGYSY